MKSRRIRGFTLIEIMIVIAIIGILAAIMVPSFGRAKNSSRYSACVQNERSILTASQMYRNDNAGLPSHNGHMDGTHPLETLGYVSHLICPSGEGATFTYLHQTIPIDSWTGHDDNGSVMATDRVGILCWGTDGTLHPDIVGTGNWGPETSEGAGLVESWPAGATDRF